MWFKTELSMQDWVAGELKAYGCDVQVLTEDLKYPGVPDLSIACDVEVWVELKLIKTVCTSRTKLGAALKKNRPLTAQQRKWLLRRHRYGGNCGVLIGWELGDWMPSQQLISFIPIQHWDNWLLRPMSRLVNDNYYTASMTDLRNRNHPTTLKTLIVY